MTKSVAIVFSDGTLGGTSRSAITMARAWSAIGWAPVFVPLRTVAEGRREAFEGVGALLTLETVDWASIDMIHFHQSGSDEANASAIDAILACIGRGRVPPMLCHNIFAYGDAFMGNWPAARSVAVLGEWAAWQYMLSKGALGQRPLILGNPQDDDFFRPPSKAERRAARSHLRLQGSDQLILRLGSPLRDKWGDGYAHLARRLSASQRLLLVGAPDRVRSALSGLPRVELLDPLPLDTRIRDKYWAADVFALDSLRGETFGNVIAEALLCGLPVVYRARPFRDNTPWEFQSLVGFSYLRGRRAWVESVLDTASGASDRAATSEAMHSDVGARFGLAATADKLCTIWPVLRSAPPGWVWADRGCAGRRPSLISLVGVFLFHNPLVAGAKRWRRSLATLTTARRG